MHNQVNVAHHEAAHAVIGYLLEAPLGAITLEGEESDSRLEWTGRASVMSQELPNDCVVQIGVAGTLAEIKMAIISESEPMPETDYTRELAQVKIRPESVPSIAKALWNLKSKSENPPECCLYAEVDLEHNGQMKSVRVFLGESGGDMDCVCGAVDSLENLEKVVAATRDLIDEPRIWRAVLSLAHELLKQKEFRFRRKTLSSLMTEHIIRSALPAGLHSRDENRIPVDGEDRPDQDR